MRMSTLPSLFALSLASVALAPFNASAQDEEPAMIDLTSAYEGAARRASRGDISGAIRGFKEVVAQDPFWGDAIYNIATLSEHIGAHADCALYFRRYLFLDPQADEADDVRRQIAECESEIVDAGTLVIPTTTPENTAIAVNGLVLGQGSLGPIALPAGEYEITAERTDWQPFATTVVVSRGVEAQAAVVLQPMIYFGTVQLDVLQAGANVSIDGQSIGTTPLAEVTRLQAGTYLFEVSLAGFHPWRRAIEIRRDDEQVHTVELLDERINLDEL
jgi:hypothetical protein